jgi:limonene-1,2-epoxide hydrolase
VIGERLERNAEERTTLTAGHRVNRSSYGTIIDSAVERYFNALRQKNLSEVPFAADVEFQGPLSGKLTGAEAVKEFLTGVLPGIQGVRIHRHIIDGEYVATVLDLETSFGVIPICDTFRVVNGKLTEIRPFYDPRPIVEAMPGQNVKPTA